MCQLDVSIGGISAAFSTHDAYRRSGNVKMRTALHLFTERHALNRPRMLYRRRCHTGASISDMEPLIRAGGPRRDGRDGATGFIAIPGVALILY